jgi:hypothetical protein
MEVERSSSRPSDPASACGVPPTTSRSRDGQVVWAVGPMRSGTKLQHFGTNPRWMMGSGGDRLNHPRYRDFATIPVTDFLQ